MSETQTERDNRRRQELSDARKAGLAAGDQKWQKRDEALAEKIGRLP